MAAAEAGPPVINLPERMDRRMRLGPFPSSRDALKFVLYAAVGALLSPFAAPWVWIPVVAVGFVVSVWRPEERALDERAVAVALWKIRTFYGGGPVTERPRSSRVRGALLQLGPQHHVAVVRTGGSPVNYLPPDELTRRFELFRELLRSTDGNFSFLVTTIPIRPTAVLPPGRPALPAEVPAQAGYAELVSLLCRRRLLRRVYFVLGCVGAGSDVIDRLEGQVTNLLNRLGALDLRPARLRDRALREAGRRFGWRVSTGTE